MNLRLLLLPSLLGALALAGCGVSETGSTSVAEGGVSGTGITAGVTNGFGSIIVNGTRHVTEGAELTRNGDPASLEDFRIGEVVLVEWELAEDGVTRNARGVTYESELEGPLADDADAATGTVSLLGQTVRFDDLTVFANSTSDAAKASPVDLSRGDFVQVSGFRNAAGEINATLISLEDDPPLTKVRLHGFVDSVTGTEISVEGQVVAINGSTTGDVPPGPGDFVRVRGTLTGSGELTAEHIKVLPAVVAGAQGTASDIEGLVTAVDPDRDPATDDFTVGGTRVLATAETEIEGGGLPDVVLNTRLEIAGLFDEAGIVVAEEIKILPSGEEISIRLEANVTEIGTQSLTLGFGPDLLTDMVTVGTNDLTQFEDRTRTLTSFGLDELRVSDHVEVRGYLDGNAVIATRVQLNGLVPATLRKLKGPVTEVDTLSQSLKILGILVQPDTSASLAPPDLFDQVAIDDIVGASGQADGTGAVGWDEVELEQ